MKEYWKMINYDKIPSSLEFNDSLLSFITAESCILDLGCGNGELCKKLSEKGFNVYGIDCSNKAIENAKKKDFKSHYNVMDASELCFESEYFDFTIIKAVFTVVPDAFVRKKIMEEVYRVTKQGGLIYIADFAQTWWNKIYYKRYIDNFPITGEYGTFKATNEKGEFEYMAKHFSPKEIVDLYSFVNVDVIVFDTIKVRTRSGNMIDGYNILLRKTI